MVVCARILVKPKYILRIMSENKGVRRIIEAFLPDILRGICIGGEICTGQVILREYEDEAVTVDS